MRLESRGCQFLNDFLARWEFWRVQDGPTSWLVLRRLLLGVNGNSVLGWRHEHALGRVAYCLCAAREGLTRTPFLCARFDRLSFYSLGRVLVIAVSLVRF